MFNFGKKELTWDKELFLKEEFNGEKVVSYVRAFVACLLFILAYTKAGLFTHLVMTKSVVFTTYLLVFALFYTFFLVVLFRFNIYHPIIKYISSTIDVTLCLLSIYVYKLDTYDEYATIYFLARYALLFIMLSLCLLRYSMNLAIYSGVLVGLEYYFFVIRDNYMTNLKFSFVGPDGNIHFSSFRVSEAYLKVVYLVVAGIVIGILANNLRKLIVTSISKEQDKNKLLVQNKIIETINSENKKYLDNIREGLLLINDHFLIKGHYSKFLEVIFERTDFVGISLIDLVYPENSENAEKRKLLEKYLSLLFKDTQADIDMFDDINPIKNERIKIKREDGSEVEKIITASFFKILEGERIKEIMVIFDDKTAVVNAERELAEEKQKRETELEYIAIILKAEDRTVFDFIEEATEFLDDFEFKIDQLNQRNILDEMFRGLHSLKGLARTVEFKSIANSIHNIENIISDIRDKKRAFDNSIKDDLKHKTNLLIEELTNIKSLQNKFKKFSDIALSKNQEKDVSLINFINKLKETTEAVAAELSKKINFIADIKVDSLPFLKDIKSSIVHIVRNAVDHGLEDRFERLTKGKDEYGNINIKIYKDTQNYIIEISDDGNGIDFDKIKSKAIEKGLVSGNENISNSKLLNILFLPGFSTSKTVSDISGRGVGLDVVKDTIVKLKGKISVASEKDKGTKFTIKIPT